MIKIYTKTGDKGTTALANNERVSKNSPRLESYGTVDELNCVIGICSIQLNNFSEDVKIMLNEWLFAIQNDLFNLGSDLATPIQSRWKNMKLISSLEVTQLEKMIDFCQNKLPPLKEFVLPGGTLANSYFHFARTVCRRAERYIVALSDTTEINPYAIQYINRLSDLFFILARYAQCQLNIPEVTWKQECGVLALSL